MSLRLTAIIHDYYPLVGGAQTLLRAQAPHLQALGAEVTILTRHVPGARAFERIDNIPVHRLPAPPPKALASLAFTASAVAQLLRLRPDVIHANEFISPATIALLAKRLTGVPVVVTAHRSGPIGDVLRLQSRGGGPARLEALKAQADAFVVISQEIGAELLGIGIAPEKLRYINNGVDTKRFAPSNPAPRLAFRQTLGLAPQAIPVIFTGRLVREKRLDNLLNVWPAVRASCPNAELLLLGAGDQETVLRAMPAEGVHFLGPQADVVPYLQAAEIFILPSAAEGLSVAMLEAMSCGLAPIVTKVGGSGEVITDGHNGLLIPPDDLPALQNALLELLQNAELRTKIGQAARQRIETAYSVEISARKLFNLYTELTQTSRRQP